MTWLEFQAALRERLRAQRGASTEVARRLAVSRASVAQYVSGGNPIPPAHIDTILDVLDVDLELRPRS